MEPIIQLTVGAKTKRSRFTPLPVTVDWNGLPDAAQEFAIRYGIRQFLADAMAGAETEEEAHNNVRDRLAKLVSGDLSRTKGEPKSKPDTVETRARKLAKAYLIAEINGAGGKVKDIAKESFNEAIAELVKDDPSFMATAKEQLAKEASLVAKPSKAVSGILAGILAKAAGNAGEEDEDETDDEEGDDDAA